MSMHVPFTQTDVDAWEHFSTNQGLESCVAALKVHTGSIPSSSPDLKSKKSSSSHVAAVDLNQEVGGNWLLAMV